MADLGPSAAMTNFARARLPSLKVTRASLRRVNNPTLAIPLRSVTFGSWCRILSISRRNSQLGRFQPNGSSEMSRASNCLVTLGVLSPAPASMICITSSGVACVERWSHSPNDTKKSRAGCKNAVLRRSAPGLSRSVTGRAGSTQSTSNPALPKATAVTSPAKPAPEIIMSKLCCIMPFLFSGELVRHCDPVEASSCLRPDVQETAANHPCDAADRGL